MHCFVLFTFYEFLYGSQPVTEKCILYFGRHIEGHQFRLGSRRSRVFSWLSNLLQSNKFRSSTFFCVFAWLGLSLHSPEIQSLLLLLQKLQLKKWNTLIFHVEKSVLPCIFYSSATRHRVHSPLDTRIVSSAKIRCENPAGQCWIQITRGSR